MSKKSALLVVVLLCCFNLTFAQDTAISNAINISNTQVEKTDTISSDNQFLSLWKGWSVGFNYGLTQFDGDIRNKGLFEKSSMASIYSLNFTKSINKLIGVSFQISNGKLLGERLDDSYSLSQTTNNLYDPYRNYEGNGERFENNFYEIEVLAKFDVEEIYLFFNSNYLAKSNFQFHYNIGYGEIIFESLKRNIESGTYIYAYGYDDLGDGYESQIKMTKAKILIYGLSIEYNIYKKFNIELSSIKRLAFTDYLDASLMKSIPSNDSYRVILLGLKYNIN